jgi:hypothetical protein
MTPQTTSPEGVLRLAVGCIVVSVLAALAFLVGGHVASVRGPAGGVGIMAALFGSGVALWFAVRARNRRLVVAAVISVLPLAFWCWVIYEIVHG